MAWDYQKVIDGINSASGAMSSVAGVAGAGGYTVGAAIQGYKDGRAGDTSNYRQINDIDVGVEAGESVQNVVKWVVVGAVVIAAAVLIFKKRK